MKKSSTKTIFLDYASVTPLDPKVQKVLRLAEDKFWGNPSSLHTPGEEAKNALQLARTQIAKILQCRSQEVVFTSGGTESLNLAILGTVRAAQLSGIKLPHIIVSTIEHPAVLEPIKALREEGEIEVSYIVPDQQGLVKVESVVRELKKNTVLVAIQHANNEIGTLQPIIKIAAALKDFRQGKLTYPYFLVDASQSLLYENVTLERLGADFLILDGIKIYGPRGTGLLIARHGVNLSPIIFGGGQEAGLRSGTENVPAALGLAKALEVVVKLREKESGRLSSLRNYAITELLKIPGSSLNGDLENRLPNNINICFAAPAALGLAKADPKIDSEFLVIKLDTLGFAVSAASACHTLSLENGSYVIEALSSASLNKKDCASSSLRFTLGRSTKKSDLSQLIKALKKVLLRQ